MFETDYPHSDSTWPHSREVGQKLMILMDPPRHTWHRKVMSHMFSGIARNPA